MQVIIEAILETTHKDVLWPIEPATQILKLLGVLNYWAAPLPRCFNVILGLVVSQ